jgi:hypothetical protein
MRVKPEKLLGESMYGTIELLIGGLRFKGKVVSGYIEVEEVGLDTAAITKLIRDKLMSLGIPESDIRECRYTYSGVSDDQMLDGAVVKIKEPPMRP